MGPDLQVRLGQAGNQQLLLGLKRLAGVLQRQQAATAGGCQTAPGRLHQGVRELFRSGCTSSAFETIIPD